MLLKDRLYSRVNIGPQTHSDVNGGNEFGIKLIKYINHFSGRIGENEYHIYDE